MDEQHKKAWSGRFKSPLNKEVEVFNASITFDQRLYKQDIEGSIAHAKMLAKQKIIPEDEAQTIINALSELKSEIDAGKVEFSLENEDIHMNIEALLVEKIGPVAKKLHTARSRNDQVALDFKLFLREEINDVMSLIKNLITAVEGICKEHKDTLIPGYTHLQRAQPITLALHFGAYKAMLERDFSRMKDCIKRLNFSPLGAGSLAGSTLPVDRNFVAQGLNFDGIVENSMDAVSDRDYALEFLSASSILAMHLSRMSEELIIWASEEYGFISLHDAFATGSSLMPQKKNPDVPELIRGKTGRVYGNLMALLTTMKALPMAYNKDMQEDKEPIFDTVDTIKGCLKVLTPFLENTTFNKEPMKGAAENSFIFATELVDYLVEKGVKFRDAHEIIGNLVHYCLDKKVLLQKLTIEEFKEHSEAFADDVYKYLEPEHALKRRGLI